MTLAASRPAIKAKALLRWPAAILQGAGISVTRANGNVTFALNFPALADNTGVSDPSQYTTAVYNRTSGAYEELRLDYLPTPTEAANRTPRGDANYSILNTDRYVALTATLAAPRTWTLQAASAVPAGRVLVIGDEVGGISSANTLTLTSTGSDTINGASSYVLATARGGVEFRSDGTSKWSARVLADLSVTTGKLADGAVTTPKIAAGAVGTAQMAASSVTNGILAAAPAATLKANLTGAAASPTDISIAALLTALGLAFGQCRLVYTSATALALLPRGGNQLWVNGALRTIPAAGVALANTGLTAATLYYVYAFMSGSTLTLEASTTGHATDTTYGHEIKSGDGTRTLVGMIYTGAGTPGTFADTPSQRFVASWFNRPPRPLIGTYSGSSTGSSSPVALSTGQRVSWVAFADEVVDVSVIGRVYGSAVGAYTNTYVYVDGAMQGVSTLSGSASDGAGNTTSGAVAAKATVMLTDGYHYADAYGDTHGANGNWNTNIVGAVLH